MTAVNSLVSVTPTANKLQTCLSSFLYSLDTVQACRTILSNNLQFFTCLPRDLAVGKRKPKTGVDLNKFGIWNWEQMLKLVCWTEHSLDRVVLREHPEDTRWDECSSCAGSA